MSEPKVQKVIIARIIRRPVYTDPRVIKTAQDDDKWQAEQDAKEQTIRPSNKSGEKEKIEGEQKESPSSDSGTG